MSPKLAIRGAAETVCRPAGVSGEMSGTGAARWGGGRGRVYKSSWSEPGDIQSDCSVRLASTSPTMKSGPIAVWKLVLVLLLVQLAATQHLHKYFRFPVPKGKTEKGQ